MSFRAFYLRKKYWINDFFHGSQMWKQYYDVLKIINNQDFACKQRKIYVDNIITYAKQNVPYYIGMPSLKKLSDFPVVNKQTYLSDYEAFCVPNDKIPGQIGNLHIQKTSGSTGTPFAVPQDTRCRMRRIAIIKGENEKIGFHSFAPMMHLRAVSHYWGDVRDFVYSKDLNIWYVDNANLDISKISEIIKVINDKRVMFVRGYMTTLDLITRYMEENRLQFNHKVTFISVGELLQEWLRKRIVYYLKCNIISQYGNEENGIFGQSKINDSGRHINLNGAGCIVEVLKMDKDEAADKGELGRIVITDLTNYAFPMIRYEIGDLAAPCEYYDDGTIKSIDNLSGRVTDMIYNTNGNFIDIYNSIPIVIFNNPLIKQFQFIQKDKKEYLMNISIKTETVKNEELNFINELKTVLGNDAIVKINWEDELPVLNSGKRKIVINEWKKK